MQGTHRIGQHPGLHITLGPRRLMTILSLARIGRQHSPRHRLPEPRRRLRPRPIQHPRLDLGPSGLIQRSYGVDKDPRVPHRDLTPLEHLERRRQRPDKHPRRLQPVIHRHRRHLQRTRDLFTHVLPRLHQSRHPKPTRHHTRLDQPRQQPLLHRISPRPHPPHLDKRINPSRLRQHPDIDNRQHHRRRTHRNVHTQNAKEGVRQKPRPTAPSVKES